MPDNIPVEPAQQQGGSDDIDWKARYTGASTVINRLTSEKQNLETQLAAKASELEQLRSSLGVAQVEKDTAVNSYKLQLEKALTDKSTADRELGELRAMKGKLEVARKLGANHLMPILDKIPYVEDPVMLETLMRDFLSWGQELVTAREKQLLAGASPTAVVPSSEKPQPASVDGWQKYLNSLPLGSPERAKAMENWWKWGQSQTKP